MFWQRNAEFWWSYAFVLIAYLALHNWVVLHVISIFKEVKVTETNKVNVKIWLL